METKIEMKGHVDYWRKDRGFGFIYDAEKKTRYFGHISAVVGGKIPQTGNLVEFEPGQTQRGLCAINIRVIDYAEVVAEMFKAGQ